jgi:hypothetical protein
VSVGVTVTVGVAVGMGVGVPGSPVSVGAGVAVLAGTGSPPDSNGSLVTAGGSSPLTSSSVVALLPHAADPSASTETIRILSVERLVLRSYAPRT